MQVSAADMQTVASMFDTKPEVITTATGMMVVSPQVHPVMLMRRAEDGSLVVTCVTSAAQADAFLHPKQAAARETDR